MLDTESLINAHRPQTWKQVLGQDALVRALQAAVEDRTAHQFILSGPSGTGKTTCARLIADHLGCKNPYQLDAATNNSVDDVRSIIEQLKYKPIFEDEVKVFILDEVHMLSRGAWNALLKSVEEPPSWVYWCLCSTDPGKIPDTVRTRCFHAKFKPVMGGQLFLLLKQICDKEKFDTPEDILDVCVAEAEGSPRQAIANLVVCVTAHDVKEARFLLQSAEHDPDVIEIAKLLINGATWPTIRPVIARIQNVNVESARRQIAAYVGKVVINTAREDQALHLFRILDQFSSPWYDNNGTTQLVVAIGRCLFTE